MLEGLKHWQRGRDRTHWVWEEGVMVTATSGCRVANVGLQARGEGDVLTRAMISVFSVVSLRYVWQLRVPVASSLLEMSKVGIDVWAINTIWKSSVSVV